MANLPFSTTVTLSSSGFFVYNGVSISGAGYSSSYYPQVVVAGETLVAEAMFKEEKPPEPTEQQPFEF